MEEINLEELTFEKDDLLNRKQIAVNLTNIIKNKSNLNVLAIDSSWGTGKTTFIKMWINMLKTDKFNIKTKSESDEYILNEYNYCDYLKTIYFNAWENDYINDPLISLLSTLEENLDELKNSAEKHIENSLKTLKKYSKPLLSSLVKVITSNILDLEKIDLGKKTEEMLPSLSNDLTNLVLNDVLAKKEVRILIKSTLKEYIDKVNKDSTSSKKVIIFIDELDRCRPTYAIELLETIKHFFNIENYIFVISLDKIQLSHSIKTVYGQDMDSEGYLRRFFDLEYPLHSNKTNIYIENKLTSNLSAFKNTYYLKTFLKSIFIEENYSLRDIDKTLTFIEILLSNVEIFNGDYIKSNIEWTPLMEFAASYLYAYLINLKIKHSDFLNSIFSQNYKIDNIKDFPKLDTNNLNLESNFFTDSTAKKVILNILKLFLKLNLELINIDERFSDLQFRKSFFISLNNNPNQFINYTTYDKTRNLDLMFFFNEHKILEKFQFADSFTLS